MRTPQQNLSETEMPNHYGSILLYDRSYKRISCVDENDARRMLAKFLSLLRTHGLDYAEEILRCLLSIPRNITYFGLQYHIENFGPLQLLGSGGFGTVFKAVHKLDEKEYAIKIVHGIRSLSDLESARSEVSMMARLSHENVVQYVTSWVEYGFLPFLDQLDASKSVTPSYTSSGSIGNNHRGRRNPCSASKKRSVRTFQDPHSFATGIADREMALSLTEIHHRRRSFVPRRALFIQLELCQYNLAQWIEERNSRLSSAPHIPTSSQHPSDALLNSIAPHAPARWLSDQIARAVAYLHSMKIMHRDLKPENVVLCGPPLRTLSDKPCGCRPNKLRTSTTMENPRDSATDFNCYHQLVAKLCDFGLARFLQRSVSYDQSPKFIPNQSHYSICPPEPHIGQSESTTLAPWSSSFLRSPSEVLESCGPHEHATQPNYLATTGQQDGLLTANLGSEIYAAPEVLIRSVCSETSTYVAYDYKADIFSMAVIFLQLFHPMRTLHESIECLQRFARYAESDRNFSRHASSEALPPEFVLCWPEESLLVAQMLSARPSQRPSASSILRYLATSSELLDLTADEDGPSVSSTTEDHSNEVTAHRTSSGHQMLDLLLWRNRQLQRELEEALQRLSLYEAHFVTPVSTS